MKLQTPVDCGKSPFTISYKDKILIVGSCFADNVGHIMAEQGFDVCVNPFGTLYNPQSIANSLRRLASAEEFVAGDCEMMGSGAGLVCSFYLHTSFARLCEEEFLENANARLREAAEFYRKATVVVITLGTSWCYRHIGRDIIVSNCLKRDAREFTREFLQPEESAQLLGAALGLTGGPIYEGAGADFGLTGGPIYEGAGAALASGVQAQDEFEGSGPEKKVILTVSPIRHLKDGAHGNQLSKAALLLAAESLCRQWPERCTYFPSYEIMMDELRDYRFWAEDMVHPSDQAVKYIWERFCNWCLDPADLPLLAEHEKQLRQSRHRPNLTR